MDTFFIGFWTAEKKQTGIQQPKINYFVCTDNVTGPIL